MDVLYMLRCLYLYYFSMEGQCSYWRRTIGPKRVELLPYLLPHHCDHIPFNQPFYHAQVVLIQPWTFFTYLIKCEFYFVVLASVPPHWALGGTFLVYVHQGVMQYPYHSEYSPVFQGAKTKSTYLVLDNHGWPLAMCRSFTIFSCSSCLICVSSFETVLL